jgi:hypothetical protein
MQFRLVGARCRQRPRRCRRRSDLAIAKKTTTPATSISAVTTSGTVRWVEGPPLVTSVAVSGNVRPGVSVPGFDGGAVVGGAVVGGAVLGGGVQFGTVGGQGDVPGVLLGQFGFGAPVTSGGHGGAELGGGVQLGTVGGHGDVPGVVLGVLLGQFGFGAPVTSVGHGGAELGGGVQLGAVGGQAATVTVADAMAALPAPDWSKAVTVAVFVVVAASVVVQAYFQVSPASSMALLFASPLTKVTGAHLSSLTVTLTSTFPPTFGTSYV